KTLAVHAFGEEEMAADDAADGSRQSTRDEQPVRDGAAEGFLDVPRDGRRDDVQRHDSELMGPPPDQIAALRPRARVTAERGDDLRGRREALGRRLAKTPLDHVDR